MIFDFFRPSRNKSKCKKDLSLSDYEFDANVLPLTDFDAGGGFWILASLHSASFILRLGRTPLEGLWAYQPLRTPTSMT